MSKTAKIWTVIVILAIVVISLIAYYSGSSGSQNGSYTSDNTYQTQGTSQSAQAATPASGKVDDIIGDFKAESQTEDGIASEDDKNSQAVAGDASAGDQFNTNTDENQY